MAGMNLERMLPTILARGLMSLEEEQRKAEKPIPDMPSTPEEVIAPHLADERRRGMRVSTILSEMFSREGGQR